MYPSFELSYATYNNSYFILQWVSGASSFLSTPYFCNHDSEVHIQKHIHYEEKKRTFWMHCSPDVYSITYYKIISSFYWKRRLIILRIYF